MGAEQKIFECKLADKQDQHRKVINGIEIIIGDAADKNVRECLILKAIGDVNNS
jgi:hypothetical protein